jgi:hypothetical protein
MPPQHQAPPTNHYQPLPPQEIKVIEVEPPKAVEEKFSAVRPDAPETEPQAETSKTAKKSSKGKKTKKKPKNKK